MDQGTQLVLFEGDHVHVYDRYQGPYKTQEPVTVGTGRGETRWCWTCTSWVDVCSVSYRDRCHKGVGEVALMYAREVRKGFSRHDAYWLMLHHVTDFGEACLLVDEAVGILNSRG